MLTEGIVMNEILRRELERYVRTGKFLPENLACTTPVFLVCVPGSKGSPKVVMLRTYFGRNFHLDSTMSVSKLADQIETEFSNRVVCDFRGFKDVMK
jgi:hypothetical protein